ncbi:MAG: molybdopterin-binding protein, partial [Treponema sp.]|nr:molybdopterin-binding protein [Treponema sp.]
MAEQKRNLNLKLTPVDEALAEYLSALDSQLVPKFEVIPVEESLGRVTSVPVCAKLNSPHYNAAAMDGIAVKSADFHGERKSSGTNDSGQLQLPILRDLCGLNSSRSHFDFINVNTGDIVQEPYDAVIMAEDLIYEDNGKKIKITKNVSPGQHIRLIGESIRIGEEILSAKHKIRPVDIGMLLTAGITTIEVYTIPKVAIFPTGSEIIDICASNLQTGEAPEAGKIIESNSRMYEAQVKQAGGEGVRFNPVPDNFDLLKNAVIKAAAEFDIVLINAGSSAGTEDFTVQVLREIGEVIIHGVAMKPGKPVILAIVNGKPVIGTPGYPVSAFLSFETFALPILSVLT